MSLKTQLKGLASSLAGFAFDAGLTPRFIRLSKRRHILAYHRVVPAEVARARWMERPMWISPESFEASLDVFQRLGRLVSLDELLRTSRPESALFAVTFDDGWRDNLDIAAPILSRRNIPATLFVSTEAVFERKPFWVNRFIHAAKHAVESGKGELLRSVYPQSSAASPVGEQIRVALEWLKEVDEDKRMAVVDSFAAAANGAPYDLDEEMLRPDDLRSLEKMGFTIGAHSHSHEILKGITRERAWFELTKPKQVLESFLGHEVTLFCYPNARYDAWVPALAQQAGYRFAFKIDNEPVGERSGQWTVPRYSIYEAVAERGMLVSRLLRFPGFI